MMRMNLKDIQKPIAHLLEETGEFLREDLKSDIELINMIGKSTPILKGKKIRSTLLFLLAGMNDTFTPELPRLAAAIEMLHLSSLIHDDVVDNSEFRRGERTLNSHFGNFLSVLWGDFLFIHSLDNFSSSRKEFADIILRCAKAMIEGQLLEVENTENYDIALATYFEIIKKKTSALFAGVAEIASTLNGASRPLIQKFHDFGMDFGTLFQVSDDILDIFSDNSGKDRFRDLKEGKITLPIILLLKENQKDAVENFSEENKDQLLELIKKYKIEESSLEKVQEFQGRCVAFLDDFPDSVYKESLSNLLNFVLHRDY